MEASLASKELPQAIYIDALALVPERKSGVGATLEYTLDRLSSLPELTKKNYTIYLVVPLGKARHLKPYIRTNIKIRTIYLPARFLEVLLRTRLLPPVDWVLGKGVYVFPNYRNWPLWSSRSITYIYDIGFIRFPSTVAPKNLKYLKKYSGLWVSRADKVIAITEYLKGEIERYLHVPITKIETVYCGVDTALFYKRTVLEAERVKKKYGIPDGKYLLFVGNLEPRKNLAKLIDAYQKLPEPLQREYSLVVVGGDGWLNDTFYKKLDEARQQGLPIIKVDEYVPTSDLPALYSGASALVHPAVYEGFGITPLEAMACETPVVVSDIEAIREVVREDGYYCDPSSTDSLIDAIEKCLKDKKNRQQTVQDGKKRASEYSWNAAAAQLYAVIEGQFTSGPVSHPFLRKSKDLYVKLDKNVRKLLGEHDFPAYRPKTAFSERELEKFIIADFMKEQPSRAQVHLLRGYVWSRHVLSLALRRVYRG